MAMKQPPEWDTKAALVSLMKMEHQPILACPLPRVSSDCWTRELPEKRQTTEVYIYILRNRFKACTQHHRKDYDRKRPQQLETTDNLIIIHANKSLQRESCTPPNRDSPNASETRDRSDNAEFKK